MANRRLIGGRDTRGNVDPVTNRPYNQRHHVFNHHQQPQHRNLGPMDSKHPVIPQPRVGMSDTHNQKGEPLQQICTHGKKRHICSAQFTRGCDLNALPGNNLQTATQSTQPPQLDRRSLDFERVIGYERDSLMKLGDARGQQKENGPACRWVSGPLPGVDIHMVQQQTQASLTAPTRPLDGGKILDLALPRRLPANPVGAFFAPKTNIQSNDTPWADMRRTAAEKLKLWELARAYEVESIGV